MTEQKQLNVRLDPAVLGRMNALRGGKTRQAVISEALEIWCSVQERLAAEVAAASAAVMGEVCQESRKHTNRTIGRKMAGTKTVTRRR